VSDLDYTVKQIADMQREFGGAFVRARAELGVMAFGLQIIDLPPNSGDLHPEHDHLHDSQEEVYLLLDGSATMHLRNHEVALTRETLVRVGPSTRRRARSGPDGARLLVVSGVAGSPYVPAPISELDGTEAISPTASTSSLENSPASQLR
jgi:mannose-6-phosphate isomerase-like protein (cupin superfamily)